MTFRSEFKHKAGQCDAFGLQSGTRIECGKPYTMPIYDWAVQQHDRIEELEAEVSRRDRNIDMMDQRLLELEAENAKWTELEKALR